MKRLLRWLLRKELGALRSEIQTLRRQADERERRMNKMAQWAAITGMYRIVCREATKGMTPQEAYRWHQDRARTLADDVRAELKERT